MVASSVSATEILFIDGAVPDLATLLAGIRSEVRVFVLDPALDGVQQIADILVANDLHNLAAIQIVSHGAEGEVTLGSVTLSETTMPEHAAALADIGAALAPGGDLLLYGCDVGHGDGGQQFLQDLAEYTGGANVAASTDLTGSPADGGNWTLETSTGPIEADTAFVASAAGSGVTLASAPTRQAVFIDSRVPDLQDLINGAKAGELVFVLSATGDGLQQIADIIAREHLVDLAAISIVSHGSSGAIQLGSTTLDDDALGAHAAQLATIGAALVPDGDLQLYGCNVAEGEAGIRFIADLAKATGADVAASDNLTGAAAKGGDWNLEITTGAIEATNPFTVEAAASFNGLLATFTDPLGSNGTIPDGPGGAVVHRTVTASGLSGTITSVSVTLTGFTHTFPDDLGFLLVGPDGTHNLEFWSDAGGFGPGVSNITVTVADSGATLLPDNTAPANNTTYRPADYLDAEPNTFFGLPALTISHPTGGNVPGTATFGSVFNGLAGNGTWDLYVKDEGAGDTGSFATWSVNITTSGGNQAPTISNLNGDSRTVTEGGAAVLLDAAPAATVADTDSANFDTGNLTVSITANEFAAEDVLGISTAGTVSLSAGVTIGSTVSVSGTAIGTISANGASGNDLVVNFNSNATPTLVTTLVDALTYQNTNSVNPNINTRTISVTVDDGDGGTSTSNPAFITVGVTATGDEPMTTFTNSSGSGVIPDNPAAGIHQTLTVAGLAGNVTDVKVTISGLTHTSPNDLDFLLVAPDGTHNLEFWSDAGGSTPGVVNLNVSVADFGSTQLQQFTAPTTNTTYRAADYLNGEIDSYFGSATGAIHHPSGNNNGIFTFASSFAGVGPNGAWSLYVRDGGNGDTGLFTSWSLAIATDGGPPVDAAPVISGLNGDNPTFTEGGTALLLDVGGDASVADTDSPNFATGNLTVSITANKFATEDVLGISTAGAVSLSAGTSVGSTVSVSGTAIGTIAANGDGVNGHDLIVTFNANATPTLASTLIDALTYFNSNSVNPNINSRTVSVTVNDGDGVTSGAALVTVGVTATGDDPMTTFTSSSGAFAAIPDGPSGAAVSQTLNVAGLAGTVADVKVTITGLTHTAPADLDFLLVSPDGTHNLEFWSDAGGSINPGVSNVTVSVADFGASQLLQNTSPTTNTTYRAADYLNGENDAYFGSATGAIQHPSGNNNGIATFAPAFNGAAPNGNWTLYVRDGSGLDTGGFTSWSLAIATTGSPPVILDLGGDTSTFTEDGPAVRLDDSSAPEVAASVTDDQANLNGGNLTVSTTVNEVAGEDVLGISTAGTGVTLSNGTNVGSTVSVSGTAIGTIAAGGNGTGGNDLVVTFNTTDATPANISTLIRALTYFDSNTLNPSALQRTIAVSVNDGNGGVDTENVLVNVTAQNDAPVLNAAATPVLNAVAEDAPAPSGAVGTLISSLVDFTGGGGNDNVSDPDGAGALTGIALTNTVTTNGTWFYTIDGGTNWLAVGAVTDDSARLLAADANTRLYFQPTTADFNGTITDAITFRAWDQTSGANGALADPTPAGGTTAFSTAPDTANITVTAVNDAPVLDSSKTPVLNAEDEDSGAPVNGSAVGTLVSALVDLNPPAGGLDNVTDIDASPVTGIALTATSGGGTWFYSIDGGANWNAVGVVSDGSARLLAADANTRLYYQPAANVFGTISPAITFRAWDQSTGTNGQNGVNTVPNGNTTAFSTATDTADIAINSVNDAPVLNGLGDVSSFTENGASVLLDTNTNATVSDPELNASVNKYAGATLTLARTGGANPDDTFAGSGSLDLTDSNGLGENVSLDGGATFIGTLSQPGDGTFSITFNANAGATEVNSVMRQIVYAHASDNPPTSVQIDFTFSDGNGQPGGQSQGTGATPGTATASVTVNITQVDDAPVLLNVTPTAAYAPGSSGVVLSSSLQVFDPDATPPSPLTGLASATIKIESGFLVTDQLFVNLATSGGHFVTPDSDVTNISVQSNVAGTLILSGNDTVAHYQSVLDAVSYRSTAADPSNGGADPTRNISWQVNDGLLNSQTPNPDPNNLVNETILHFNAPPTVDLDASGVGTGFTTTHTENGPATAIVDSDVVITDPDDAVLFSAQIVLTNAKPNDVLSIAGALPVGIDSSINTSIPGQITINLLNPATLADYQVALGQIRFSTTDLSLADRDIAISGSNDFTSNVAHTTMHVAPLHLTGTSGNDSFTMLPGNEIVDAGNGVDTMTFGFRLVDATVTYSGNRVIIDGPGSHTVLTGFEVFNFTDGTVHNDDGSPLIDDLFYYSRYHDVWNAHVDADAHYNSLGWHELRDPNAFFDTNLYLSANPDVKAAGVNPLTQYDSIGWTQHRIPSLTFDGDLYLAANPDVAAAHVDPLAHFLGIGAGEGRLPIAPTEWLMPNGFDFVFYMQHNPDVVAAHIDPFQHFETIGWTEGRNPNALFDTNGYLAAYPDVAAAHVNPLDHFHNNGWLEGRDPSVGFDTTSYLAAYPDVAAAHIDPLVHFLDNGIHEGRSPFADGVFG